jgi:hypothetical protein
MQIVELHYRRKPTCDYAAVKARAQEILESELDSSDPGEAGEAFLIVHKQHPVRYSGGEEVPAGTSILASDQPFQLEAYRQEIQQSWRCRGAEDLLRGSQESRLVTEMMARLLPPQERVSLFHGVLRAMIDVTAPDALVFKHSQQVVAPADYLAACPEDPIFQKGPVIESGQTVAGIQPGSKWRCQFENSLLEPKRELLDLNPGGPHAAGNR